jgi:NAD(P)-dependent dehydrogenase (short-subunit alcohol dehydrogenase family)
VWGTARELGRLDDLTRAHPSFHPVALDLADPAAAEAAYHRAADAAGGAFDVVIHNAGYGIFGDFAATDFAVWQRQLDAMLATTLRLAHAALRDFRVRPAGGPRGCLVNVASLAVEFPLPGMTGYNVAKAGLAAASESLIVETRGEGISVIDFRPGDYRTDFNLAMQLQFPGGTAPADSRLRRAWTALERNLQAAPPPARAAADLRRALRRGRSGTVRSGSFFQARLAPLFARLAPLPLRRAVTGAYFGTR